MSRVQPGQAPRFQAQQMTTRTSSPASGFAAQQQQQQPQRATGTYSNGGNYGLAPRTIAREKWAREFGGTAYLEGGASNRIVLALRSPIPSEIDWALDRLVQVSGSDPELLRLAEFPGLLEGLLQHIRSWLDSLPSSSTASAWSSSTNDSLTKRAIESALTLRNLAPESVNLVALNKSKKLPQIIVDVLAASDADDTAEICLACLEVLETISETFILALPGRSIRPDRGPEPTHSPSVRLFPLLVALTCSADRALVIAGFRCLTALSANNQSDLVVALLTYPSDALYPHPIETAISLLPLFDPDLSLTILDFVYQHTLLPANAVAFCARPDLKHILRLVKSKLHQSARTETVEAMIPQKDTDAELYFKKSFVPGLYTRPARINQPLELSPKMSPPELAMLLAFPEPKRALNWMRLAFEEYPTGEITQVALWTAYRAEFEHHVTPERPMLPAAEVVKMSTDAFPSALPMVAEVPERKFIIRGVRVRDRTDMKAVFSCRWHGCLFPIGPTSPEVLYWHLHHSHLSSPSTSPMCSWANCSYISTSSNPAADLSLHVRTHIPAYHPPPGYGGTPLPSTDTSLQAEPTSAVRYDRFHAEQRDAELTGLALLGCLVFRNVARTIRTALGPAGAAELAGGEESIFEAFTKASEGTAKRDEVMQNLEKVDFEPARKGKVALDALEEDLAFITMSDHLLGSKVLYEVLGVIVNDGRAP